MRFLIVEDSEAQSLLLSLLLEPIADSVCCVKSWAQAEEAMKASPDTNVLMLDLGLPDSTPDMTVGRIREVKAKANAPAVFVMSGHYDEQIVAAAIRAGADGFVEKAMMASVLPQIARTLLRRGARGTEFAHGEDIPFVLAVSA